MRLSEAIRLGSMLRPQAFGSEIDEQGRTCAFGAALEAIGQELYGQAPLKDFFPIISSFKICPACGKKPRAKQGVISTHLNDKHRWSREKIADYVESVEREIEAKQQPTADSLVDEALVAK